MKCRVCGCTDREPCENGCGWVQSGLCTECLPLVRETRCPEASCESMGKWCRRPSGHSGPFVAFHRGRINNARRRLHGIRKRQAVSA